MTKRRVGYEVYDAHDVRRRTDAPEVNGTRSQQFIDELNGRVEVAESGVAIEGLSKYVLALAWTNGRNLSIVECSPGSRKCHMVVRRLFHVSATEYGAEGAVAGQPATLRFGRGGMDGSYDYAYIERWPDASVATDA